MGVTCIYLLFEAEDYLDYLIFYLLVASGNSSIRCLMYLEVLYAELGTIYAFAIAIVQTYNIFFTSNKCLLLNNYLKVFTWRKYFSEYKDKG